MDARYVTSCFVAENDTAMHTARKQPIRHRGRCHGDMYSAASEAADNGVAGWSRLDGMSGNFYGGHPRLRLIQSDLRIYRINDTVGSCAPVAWQYGLI